MEIATIRTVNGMLKCVQMLGMAALLCAVSCSTQPQRTSLDEPRVTFHEQVEPILQNRCLSCHQKDGSAPFALETYEEARNKRQTIRRVVSDRLMPPWHASPAHGKFQNDCSLSEEEIAAITRWVDGGAPRGDSAKAPSRQPTTAWGIGAPDAVFTTPSFDVPAEGKLLYEYVRVPTNFAEDRWVEAMQLKWTGGSAVHHVLVFLEGVPPPPKGAKRPWRPRFEPLKLLQGADPKDYGKWIMRYTDLIQRDLVRGSGGGMDGYFVTSASGNIPMSYPEGRAKLLPAGATLVFQIHYTPNGKPQPSQTSLAFRFAKQPPREPVDTRAIATVAFTIPPHVSSHVVEASYQFPRDCLLVSLMPHMHQRGKSFRYVAEYPDGRRETLLDVPRFDFNWQYDYIFTEPKRIPRNTVLRAIATYDNSVGNLGNPDPSKEVYFGIQSDDEMLIGYFTAIWQQENWSAQEETRTSVLRGH